MDDEKFIFKPGIKLEETRQFAIENAKDIIACGFDPDKTFIFMNTNYVGFVSIYSLLNFFFYINGCRYYLSSQIEAHSTIMFKNRKKHYNQSIKGSSRFQR